MVFDCCKWDTQVEDVQTLASYPLVLGSSTWHELSDWAERLTAEALEAEAELLERPDLLARLGLPRSVRAVLARKGDRAVSRGLARVIRYDFHLTPEGWRISEANTDVPGGFIEASAFSALMARHYHGTTPAGDPAGSYVDAIVRATGPRSTIALVHATAYSDDHQVMRYLAQRFQQAGARPVLVSPAHIGWDRGQARLRASWTQGSAAALVRFFPAEWLPNFGRTAPWQTFFVGGETPASNPAGALVIQSKRFPIVWDAMRTMLPTWRRLLPETRDPSEVPWRQTGDWVLKPALGRVGEGIGLPGTTNVKDWQTIRRSVFWFPRHWAAQRRFEAVPLETSEGLRYPAIGVFTIDGRVAGAYGRLAARPLIDSRAQDIAVLIAEAA